MSDGIGGSGEKDKLSYTSLTYQIQNGRKDGYMMKNLSSVDSNMLLFLLVYEIIIFVVISGIGGSEEKGKLCYTSLAYQIQNGIKDGYMLRNLSSVDSYILYNIQIIILVMISATCSKM